MNRLETNNTLLVRLFGRKYIVWNVHLSPNEAILGGQLDGLVQQMRRPFILLGDTNEHLLFGDITGNPRGNPLASVLKDQNLCVLNTSYPTHFHVQTVVLTATYIPQVLSMIVQQNFFLEVLSDL